ncbi:hypothetical protein BAC1_00641 [uncultured bacterium]|nr:hypothetical protein BAC1_00641 [uncultured bacterium]
MLEFDLRPLNDSDRNEYACLVHSSFNAWYWKKGWGADYFRCPPAEASVFYDIYSGLTSSSSVAAIDRKSGRLIGACFYHPREHHVSLGIMSVHPDYFGMGIGKALVRHIVDFTEANGYKSLRLVGSAMNMDSLSLYNKAGFVPVKSYHDMVVQVPADASLPLVPGAEMVRDAVPSDVDSMGALEMEVSGIRRLQDYLYAIENERGLFEVKVIENGSGSLDGFMMSIRHPALNMIGPGVARTEEACAALMRASFDRFRGEPVLSVIPMDCGNLVRQMYCWNARNVETHLFQVRGEFKPFNGVSIPSFLPETG